MPNLVNPSMLRRGTKKCYNCEEHKPLSEFHIYVAGTQGGKGRGMYIRNGCRDCSNRKGRARSSRKANNQATRPRPFHCEVCKEEDELMCRDHCHITGFFRGWICRVCNGTLGWAKDDTDRLKGLADYLEEFYKSKRILSLLEYPDLVCAAKKTNGRNY